MGLFSRKKSNSVQVEQPDTTERTKAESNFMTLLNAKIPEYITGYFNINNKSQPYNSDTLLKFYETVSQVNSLINYIAENCAKLPIKHYRYQSNGKKKPLPETELLKTVDKIDFDDAVKQVLIHGNLFLLKGITPGFEYPTKYTVEGSNRIFVIPQYTQDQYGSPILTKDVNDNPVIGYKKLIDAGNLKQLKIEEVIHVRKANPNKVGKNYYYGASKLYAATRSINVLANVYDTINTILSAKGALGFISRAAKQNELDPMMYQDIIENVERRINEDFGTTGSRRAIMTTLADLKWNRMDSPVNEFMPIELTAQEFAQLCNQFAVPDILFNSKGNTTYNNYKEAQKVFYTNCIEPLMSLILTSISIDAKIHLRNEWLEVDYSGIDALQIDKKTHAESKQAEINYLGLMIDKKLISKNQALEIMEFPTVNEPEFNEITKPEPIKPTVEPNNTEEDGDE